MIIDLFAGCGGADLGLRELGLDPVGFELDAHACATRAAAGLRTIRANLEQYAPIGRVEGLWASPPCQDFSIAGKGAGRFGERGRLVDIPPAWVAALRPRWVACEQVPPVIDIWHEHAAFYEALGYRTWVGVVNCADLGLPQTRRRAMLLASLDRQPTHPRVTHERDPQPSLFDDRRRWVSMAEALGWTGRVGFPRADDRGDSPDGYRERDWREADEPAFALTEKARSWTLDRRFDCVNGKQTGRLLDCATEPAPTFTPTAAIKGVWTITTGANSMVTGRGPEDIQPYERSLDEPAPTVDAKAGGAWTIRNDQTGTEEIDREWAFHEPATTIASRDLVPDRGANGNPFNGKTKSRNDGYKITVQDALVLQGFPPDFPLQGTRTAKFLQIGNAVPPVLAARCVETML